MRLDIAPFYISSAVMAMFPILPGSAKRSMPWGKPDIDNPLFTGASAERITLSERMETVQQRLTGSKFPRPRNRGAIEHELRLEQVWLTAPDDADATIRSDWVLERDALYVVSLSWHDDNPDIENSRWNARVYYGVHTPSRVLDGTVETIAFTDDKVLTAMFYKTKSGVGQIPDP